MDDRNFNPNPDNYNALPHQYVNPRQGQPLTQLNAQQINGTTYYNQSLPGQEVFRGDNCDEFYGTPYQSASRRGRGRNPGYPDNQWHSYSQEQPYHQPQTQRYGPEYETAQTNSAREASTVYRHRNDAKKGKSYQESRRGTRQTERKIPNVGMHHSQSAPVLGPNDNNQGSASKITPNRTDNAHTNKNRAYYNKPPSRRYNNHGTQSKQEYLSAGQSQESRQDKTYHQNNVENLSNTHDEGSAENRRQWEHETSDISLGQTSDIKGNPSKKEKMTVLGSVGIAKGQHRERKHEAHSAGPRAERNRMETDSRDKKQPPRKKYNDYTQGGRRGSKRGNSGRGRKDEDDETQRGSLIEQLRSNSYECMVCCDNVRREAAVWSCNNCYHVFHLHCIKKWARSPNAAVDESSSGWRCPACQNVTQDVPRCYNCFCGKVRDPDWNRFETPHTCGELCGKKRQGDCSHPCNILCHPGPCPPCLASIVKFCDCGRTKQTVKCDQATSVKCEKICEKTLNCGSHQCQKICHGESCNPCDDEITQNCYCSKEKRIVVCGTSESFQKSFSCMETCDRPLECGNHRCEQTCHRGVCEECRLLPEKVLVCPCTRTPLETLTQGAPRLSCLQPIPTCQQICGKPLACGPPESLHTCKKECHEGACSGCDGVTDVTCRCNGFEKEIPCEEAVKFNESNPFTCERRCNKKKTCGRHKCAILCCTESEHNCDQICSRKLTCNLHRCEEPCHKGNCPTCWQVSFDELRCECGTEVLYPPVHCGTRPPECTKACPRQHGCDHRVIHSCHSDENCPPCTHLTEKWCFGHHELRKNIPCYLSELSCGMLCSKELPCKEHKCLQTCHKGECMSEGEVCSQPCTQPREGCGHPCNNPCHPGAPCPPTGCRTEVPIQCECGQRREKTMCQLESSSDYQNMATSLMAMKISQDGQSVDISNLTKDSTKKKPRRLECNSECAVIERNRRLALALEIKNPDLSNKLGNPVYTAFLKDYAKQNLKFVSVVEKAFSELVKATEQSKQPRRSHAFEPMPVVQRRVIHELAELYGCESLSYDVEPKKNVVITAHRDKCWHPNITLTALIQREFNPKAPMPIPHRFSEGDLKSLSQSVNQSTDVFASKKKKSKITFTSKNIASVAKEPAAGSGLVASVGPTRSLPQDGSWSAMVKNSTPKPQEPAIDYFEMTD